MKKGDNVMISPDLTNQQDWIGGKVIDVENNSFVGVVVTAKNNDGLIFFGRADMFKLVA
ncbi:MAG: transcriptional regulator [Bacteroidales bacterium]|nr:transcriptional regulator [Bacteroidales bacterium]